MNDMNAILPWDPESTVPPISALDRRKAFDSLGDFPHWQEAIRNADHESCTQEMAAMIDDLVRIRLSSLNKEEGILSEAGNQYLQELILDWKCEGTRFSIEMQRVCAYTRVYNTTVRKNITSILDSEGKFAHVWDEDANDIPY